MKQRIIRPQRVSIWRTRRPSSLAGRSLSALLSLTLSLSALPSSVSARPRRSAPKANPTLAPLTITGTVTNDTGKGVRGALVTLSELDGGGIRQTFTDATGRYQFAGLETSQALVRAVQQCAQNRACSAVAATVSSKKADGQLVTIPVSLPLSPLQSVSGVMLAVGPVDPALIASEPKPPVIAAVASPAEPTTPAAPTAQTPPAAPAQSASHASTAPNTTPVLATAQAPAPAAPESKTTATTRATTPTKNARPVLDPIHAQTAYIGEPVELTLHAHDADVPDQDKLRYTLLSASIPSVRSDASIDAASGAFRWTPQPSPFYQRPVELTFAVTDPRGGMDTKIVLITVVQRNHPSDITPSVPSTSAVPTLPAPVTPSAAPASPVISRPTGPTTDSRPQPVAQNQPPTLAAVPPLTGVVGETLRFTLQGTDPDAEDRNALTYAVNPLPRGAALDMKTGEFFWPVRADHMIPAGYELTFTARDPHGATASQRARIMVASNRPATPLPEARQPAASGSEPAGLPKTPGLVAKRLRYGAGFVKGQFIVKLKEPEASATDVASAAPAQTPGSANIEVLSRLNATNKVRAVKRAMARQRTLAAMQQQRQTKQETVSTRRADSLKKRQQVQQERQQARQKRAAAKRERQQEQRQARTQRKGSARRSATAKLSESLKTPKANTPVTQEPVAPDETVAPEDKEAATPETEVPEAVSPTDPGLANAYVLEVAPEASVTDLCDRYAADPNVAYVQPNYTLKLHDMPNDPYYASKGAWGQTFDDLWALKKIHADRAWDRTKGEGIVVAVVDSGVDISHPDLAANIWTNPKEIPGNGIDDDGNGYIDDVHGWDFANNDNVLDDNIGHGTHVAGTIAAVGNNNLGIIGVAPKVTIMPVKGFDVGGKGDSQGLAEAIIYAASNGADVINNSWGCSLPCPSNPILEDAVRTANALGAVVVFSAGNNHDDASLYSPQNMRETITVSATTPDDQPSLFSNFGPAVDVAAPGGGFDGDSTDATPPALDIHTMIANWSGDPSLAITLLNLNVQTVPNLLAASAATPDGRVMAPASLGPYAFDWTSFDAGIKFLSVLAPSRNILSLRSHTCDSSAVCDQSLTVASNFLRLSGTSMAAPHVSGVAALVLAAHAAFTNADVRHVLRASAADVLTPGFDLETGSGLVDAGAAIALDSVPQLELSSPLPSAIFQQQQGSVPITGTAAGDGFARYALSYGIGGAPHSWTPISPASTASVIDDALGTWSIGSLRNGIYTLRLDVTTALNKVFSEFAPIFLQRTPATRLTTAEDNQSRPRIWGDRIVWQDTRNHNYDVYLYDLSTHQERAIVTNSSDQITPVISGERIVWVDSRNRTSKNRRDDLYLYDLATGQEHRITASPAKPQYPSIDGDRIVWQDARDGQYDLYLCVYDPATGACPEHQITSHPAQQQYPAVSGDWIVWEDARNLSDSHGYDIYACRYNPQTGVCPEQALTSDGADHVSPALSGHRTVWIDTRNHSYDIYLYDLEAGQEQRLTTEPANRAYPAINGDRVVWQDQRNGRFNIYLYDLATKEEWPIAVNPSVQLEPAIDAKRVVWQDNQYDPGDIFLYELLPDLSFPVMDPIAAQTAREGQLLQFEVSATEPKGGPLTLLARSLPEGAAFNPDAAAPVGTAQAAFGWTPRFDQAGTYTVTFVAKNLDGLEDTRTVSIMVANVNRPPLMQVLDHQSARVTTELSFAITATDPDGDALTYAMTGAPVSATLDQATGMFRWTPAKADSGASFPVMFTVSDGALTASQTVTVTVELYQNRPPVLPPFEPKAIKPGEVLRITFAATDPDDDALTYTVIGLPQGASYDQSTRTLSWTPTPEQTGSYTISVSVSDGTLSASQDLSLTVTTANRPPVLAAIEPKTVKAREPLTFTATATDPDPEDTVTYAVEPLPEGATFDAGVFSWTPTVEQQGAYEVILRASDGSLTAEQQVLITVRPENRAPAVDPIEPQATVVGTVLDITLHAADPDGDALTYAIANAPTGMSIDPKTGAIRWTPSAGQKGGYTIRVSVTDGQLTGEQSLAVTVRNSPPIIAPPAATLIAHVNEPFTWSVSAQDADGDVLTYRMADAPAGATLDGSSGLLTWTPTVDQRRQQVAFTVFASDKDEETAQPVSIAVVNRAPILPKLSGQMAKADVLLSVTLPPASDPDDDALTYAAEGQLLQEGRATFDPVSRVFAWTPTATEKGKVYTITVTVTDGDQSVSQSFTIQVETGIQSSNRPPVLAVIGNREGVVGQSLTFELTATDPDGDALTFTDTTEPPLSGGNTPSLTRGADGLRAQFSWTPSAEQAGSYRFHFTANDGQVDSGVQSIIITVKPASEPPPAPPAGTTTVKLNSPPVDKSYVVGVPLALTFSVSNPNGIHLACQYNMIPSPGPNQPTCEQQRTDLSAPLAFRWTPSTEGSYVVRLEAHDVTAPNSPLLDQVTVTIIVKQPEVIGPPHIQGVTSTIADQLTRVVKVGQTLAIEVRATSASNQSLRYAISPRLAGMNDGLLPGTFTWTPGEAQVGEQQITFTVTDDKNNQTAQAKMTFLVAAADNTIGPSATPNRPPLLWPLMALHATCLQPLDVPVKAEDPDHNTLYYGLEGAPEGASIDPFGTIRWIPRPDNTIPECTKQASTRQFTVWVSDRNPNDPTSRNLGLTSTQVVVVNIAPLPSGDSQVTQLRLPPIEPSQRTIYVNQPLVLSIPPAVYPDDKRRNLTYDVDPKLDQFGVQITLPSGSQPGELSWTPTLGQKGRYHLTFSVVDKTEGAKYEQTVAIEVAEHPNRPPRLPMIEPKIARPGQTLSFALPVATDPDEDDKPLKDRRFTYAATGDLLSLTENPAKFGGATDATDQDAREQRLFTWEPTLEQAKRLEGSHYITFTVTDPDGGTDSRTVEIRVLAKDNHPPRLPMIEFPTATPGKELRWLIPAADDRDQQNALTYTVSPLPSGATFNSATRTLTWTPTTAQEGSYALLVTVDDGNGGTDSQPVTLTVGAAAAGANRSPVIQALIPDQTVYAGEEIAFRISAMDPDQDELSYEADPMPEGARFGPVEKRRFVWTPTEAQAIDPANPAKHFREYPITFTVKDGKGGADSQRTVFKVLRRANRQPILKRLAPQTKHIGQTVRFNADADDPDGDALTYSYTSSPPLSKPDALFDTATGLLTWRIPAEASAAGVYQITVTVRDRKPGDTDPEGLEHSQTTTLTVLAVANRPPTLDHIAAQTVKAGQPIDFTLSAHDPDGDTLRFEQPDPLPDGAQFDPVSRRFTWTTTESHVGDHDLMFKVCEYDPATPADQHPDVLCGQQTVTLTVKSNQNHSPTMLFTYPQRVGVGSKLSFSVNASDPDGDALTYTAKGLPLELSDNKATFNPATQTFTWQPNIDQTEPSSSGKRAAKDYAVTFTAKDGRGGEDSRTITITVEPPELKRNRAPQLQRIPDQPVQVGTPVTLTVTAQDLDGDELTYTFDAKDLPQGDVKRLPPGVAGLQQINAFSAEFTWTPTLEQLGPHTITFIASDGQATDKTKTTITVIPRNRPPVLVTPVLPTNPPMVGQKYAFSLSAIDPEGDALTYSMEGAPYGADLNKQTGNFAWTPNANQAGKPFLVTFTASDGKDTAQQKVLLEMGNRLPVFKKPPTGLTARVGQEFSLRLLAEDADRDPLTYDYAPASWKPTYASLSRDAGVFRWTPRPEDVVPKGAKPHKLMFTVTDGHSAPVSQEVEIMVEPENHAPEFNSMATTQPARVNEQCKFKLDGKDVDGDALTYSMSGAPPAATLNPQTGWFNWTPAAADAGKPFSITFTVSDGLLQASKIITITVPPTSSTTPAHTLTAGSGKNSAR